MCSIVCHFSVMQRRRRPRFNGKSQATLVEDSPWTGTWVQLGQSKAGGLASAVRVGLPKVVLVLQ